MKVAEIVIATKGRLLSGSGDLEISGFTQDSRKVRPGMMYIPLKGENHDGHDFIDSAWDNGAEAIISQKEIISDKAVVLVPDTLKALQDMAAYWRQKKAVKVIAVTGSVGKTSSRDLIYSVVKEKYRTLKTEGNYNNHIGLPLTILRLQNEEVLVLEMGMNHLGEIAFLSQLAKPDIGVITNIGTAHIGELGSWENILKAKLEIVSGMKPGAPLIINNDNDMLTTIKMEKYKLIKTGINNRSQIQAREINMDLKGSSFMVDDQLFFLPIPGKHFINNALLAIAVGRELGLSLAECERGIKNFKLTKNRMDIIKTKKYLIIDGTYNASKDSMVASLDILANYPYRKIAVLGDMLELGDYSYQLHYAVGAYAAKLNLKYLVTIGKEAKAIYQGALDAGMAACFWFLTKEEALLWLDKHLMKNDIILVKASNGLKLKEVVLSLSDEKKK